MRVCLIVDNPLRDLDGLVLLGWQLARAGAEVFLVPMYEQGSDIPALQPDVVVANYIRANNRSLLRLCRAKGARIVVLDTEGIAGRTMDEYARLVSRMNCAELVDRYLLWGDSQYEAFVRGGVLPAARIVVTGCPRYDFCAQPWRSILPAPEFAPGFVLVNTNFPIVNPRFSQGSDAEVAAAIAVGFEPDHVHSYLAAARTACAEMQATIGRLAQRFPKVQFIVRPHPFENVAAYESLGAPNVAVRQVGTSLEWLNSAALLVHMNCSTSIEAVMLGCEPVSTEWLNTDTLRLAAFTGISYAASSFEALVGFVETALAGRHPPVDSALAAQRQQMIESLFHVADGQAAARACAAILEVASADAKAPAVPLFDRTLLRTRASMWTRRMLGYAAAERLRRKFSTAVVEQRRHSKAVDPAHVTRVLERLNSLATDGRRVALYPGADDSGAQRLLSGTSLRLAAAAPAATR
jgi:surface carbohydrate biosynthesis protein